MTTDIAEQPSLDGAAQLSDWGVIRAAGVDARSFLQGQLTQDVMALEPNQACLAGFCSAKGRLLASFVVWRAGPQELLLACSADLLAPTLKRLSMFVLRAKCKLSDATGEVALWGLAGDGAVQWLGDDCPHAPWAGRKVADNAIVRLPDALAEGRRVPRFIWATASDSSGPALPSMALDTWRWLEVMSGTVRIVAATSERFVPQMVNLDLVGGVSFQKGCYPGQEIVARSQYRGTLKRRAFVVDAALAVNPGEEVFHSADLAQPAGMVALSGQTGGRHAALVELKLTSLGAGELRAGSADGPLLTVGTLPYSIPTETA